MVNITGSEELVFQLKARGLRIASAESCTGGMIASAITDVSGASEIFDLGLVTYSNKTKEQFLKVDACLLAEHGAVSEEVAKAMAQGLLAVSDADMALSVTGIAGPSGGTLEKPVGLVYIGLATKDELWAQCHIFSGNRQKIRQQTVEAALSLAERYLQRELI